MAAFRESGDHGRRIRTRQDLPAFLPCSGSPRDGDRARGVPRHRLLAEAPARRGRSRGPRVRLRLVSVRTVPAYLPVLRLQQRREEPAGLRRCHGAYRRSRPDLDQRARRDTQCGLGIQRDEFSVHQHVGTRSDQWPVRRLAGQRSRATESAQSLFHQQRRRGPGTPVRPRSHTPHRMARPTRRLPTTRAFTSSQEHNIHRDSFLRDESPDSSSTTLCSTGGRSVPC